LSLAAAELREPGACCDKAIIAGATPWPHKFTPGPDRSVHDRFVEPGHAALDNGQKEMNMRAGLRCGRYFASQPLLNNH